MKCLFLSFTLVFLGMSVCLTNCHGQEKESGDTVGPAEGYEMIAKMLEGAILIESEAKDIPAFSIALVDGDNVVWAKGFGFQDKEKKQPATAESVYRVGSVSKLFTDLAVMRLVEEGKLDLDAPVTDYLPSFQPKNPSKKPITLRQLMSHRSGLVRESPVGNYFDPSEPSLEETVASLNDTALVYEPGAKRKYSNAAVSVVGLVLAQQRGKSFTEAIEADMLAPMEMNKSGFQLTPALEKDLARGWMWTLDGRRFEAPLFALGTEPAGNLYSTVLDLSNFVRMIFHDGKWNGKQVIEAETLRSMTTLPKGEEEDARKFGIGFHIEEFDGHRKVGHGGAVYGYSTQCEALPDEKLGVSAVSSLDGSNGLVSRIVDYAFRLMLAKREGKPLPAYEISIPVPESRAKQLVGVYQGEEGKPPVQIVKDNDRLFVRYGDFRRNLRSLQRGLVFDDTLGLGSTMKMTGLDEIVIDGKKFQRVKDETPKDAPKRWQGLIGEYGLDHNTLYIFEDHGKLFALIEWFYYYPLTEVSENVFAFPEEGGLYHGEKLIFTRDKNGQATEVTAAEVNFKRREIGTKDGETFKIKPVHPIDSLREGALKATPPEEKGQFYKTDFVQLAELDPTIKLDIRYATTNNFTGSVFYRQPRAFMQRAAAEAVVRANKKLKEHGLGLLVHDAYRPWYVTKMFWDATPPEMKDFVANPANGSRHNRGCAVDITLYDLKTGKPITMVAGYDEFSQRSFPNYPGGTARKRWYRELLRKTMEAEGFTVYEFEWWHFDFKDWKKYRIHNVTFEEILEEEKR